MLDIQECTDGGTQIIEYPETSIQDQQGLAMVLVATQWLWNSNLYNNRVKLTSIRGEGDSMQPS